MLAALCLLIILLSPVATDAQLQLPRINKSKSGATTSRQAREEALRAIPFDELNINVRSRINAVVDKPTIYRRLPPHTMRCDPEMYVFLVRNPEVVVGIWDAMGATQINLTRAGPFSYTATDGAGTTSEIELVYGTQELHVYYGDGIYEGTMLKNRVPGRAVLILRSRFHHDRQGQPFVTSVLDMFIEMDNVTVDTIAKTFHPVIGHFADLNFQETASFAGRLSDAAIQNEPAVVRLAGRLTKVSPEVRREFALVATNTAEKSVAMRNRETNLPTARRRPDAIRPTSAECDVTSQDDRW